MHAYIILNINKAFDIKFRAKQLVQEVVCHPRMSAMAKGIVATAMYVMIYYEIYAYKIMYICMHTGI